jgi:hypothetical protein
MMSPRSKADSAVTHLIKEMKRIKILALQVFNLASDPRSESTTCARLQDGFKKLLTEV